VPRPGDVGGAPPVDALSGDPAGAPALDGPAHCPAGGPAPRWLVVGRASWPAPHGVLRHPRRSDWCTTGGRTGANPWP